MKGLLFNRFFIYRSSWAVCCATMDWSTFMWCIEGRSFATTCRSGNWCLLASGTTSNYRSSKLILFCQRYSKVVLTDHGRLWYQLYCCSNEDKLRTPPLSASDSHQRRSSPLCGAPKVKVFFCSVRLDHAASIVRESTLSIESFLIRLWSITSSQD